MSFDSDVKRLYLDEKLGGPSIADALGCEVHRVYYSLKKQGIKRKSRVSNDWSEKIGPDGYMLIRVPKNWKWLDQMAAAGRKGHGYWIRKHRVVMAEHIGRPLLASETVHHKDGNKLNNDPSNLQLRSGNHGRGAVLRCRCCGSLDIEAVDLG